MKVHVQQGLPQCELELPSVSVTIGKHQAALERDSFPFIRLTAAEEELVPLTLLAKAMDEAKLQPLVWVWETQDLTISVLLHLILPAPATKDLFAILSSAGGGEQYQQVQDGCSRVFFPKHANQKNLVDADLFCKAFERSRVASVQLCDERNPERPKATLSTPAVFFERPNLR